MAAKGATYYKQNRLKQLRAFCYAAKSGSISRAAERLFLSQPSVSLQIQALERELETTLFERRGPKIRLTPEGKILLDIALPMVDGMDSLRDTFSERCGDLNSGDINIASGGSTILYILPPYVKEFARSYPGVRLRLLNVTGRDGMEMLRADEADFAVGAMLEVPDDVTYQPIWTFNPMLIVPLDHPLSKKSDVTMEDISQFELILPPRHLSTWRLVETVFQQHNLRYTVALEAGGWEVIKKYVEMDLGISIVTDICLSSADDGALVQIPVKDYFPTRSYGIVLRRGKFLSPQARRFIEMLAPDFFRRIFPPEVRGVQEEPLDGKTAGA